MPASQSPNTLANRRPGKYEDIDRFYQYFHLVHPPYMNAKQYTIITARAVMPQRT